MLETTDTIQQGGTYQRTFSCLKKSDGSALDVSEMTIRSQLRDSTGALLITPQTSGAGNVATINIPATQAAALAAVTSYAYIYDVEAEDASGIVYKIARVRCNCAAEQTLPEV